MKCPSCSVDLLITQRQDVEIDYCPKCRGVWLDRGELDKIIERSERHDRDYDDDDDDRRRSQADPRYQQPYPPQKKKSFWSELFD